MILGSCSESSAIESPPPPPIQNRRIHYQVNCQCLILLLLIIFQTELYLRSTQDQLFDHLAILIVDIFFRITCFCRSYCLNLSRSFRFQPFHQFCFSSSIQFCSVKNVFGRVKSSRRSV